MINLSALIIIVSPLVGTLILIFYKNKNDFKSSIIANTTIAISFILSLILFIEFLFNPSTQIYSADLIWFSSNSLFLGFGLLVDGLSVVMSFIVTFISLFVHVYSIGYMQGDKSFNRFLTYTNFFTFSMLLIIFSNNFLQLFIGWELVGLSSYLLIGFWYKKQSAIYANMKAFIVNRVGDIGLLLGVILVFIYTDTLYYADFFTELTLLSDKTISIGFISLDLLPFLSLLLFIGAAAKSAQVPLHFWLPDSMEGPTPISALIHAATMVTAGIFMVARLSPLYDLSGYVLDIILIIGLLTAFFMGLVALVQNDIKRIIAYSTISQLGYMTVALGATYYSFAIFHLLTHAFFKALLFLCAGSIIMKCHHEQNIDKMGGLRKVMPYTFYTYLIGAFSLAGFPMFSGFYSKDIIIDLFKYEGNMLVYSFLVFGIFVTTLYTFKILFKVFFGDNKLNVQLTDKVEHDDVIIFPLLALSVPSLIIGFSLFDSVLFRGFFDTSISDYLKVSQIYDGFIISSYTFTIHAFTTLNFFLIILGIYVAYLLYYKNIQLSDSFVNILILPIKILKGEYGFTYMSDIAIPNKFKKISSILWEKTDVAIIDNFIVNGIAKKIRAAASSMRLIQTGFIYHYAFAMIIGLLLFLLFFYRF